LEELQREVFIELGSSGALNHVLRSRMERPERLAITIEGLVLSFIARKIRILELRHELVVAPDSWYQHARGHPPTLMHDHVQLGPRSHEVAEMPIPDLLHQSPSVRHVPSLSCRRQFYTAAIPERLTPPGGPPDIPTASWRCDRPAGAPGSSLDPCLPHAPGSAPAD